MVENLFLTWQSGSTIAGQNVIFAKAELESPSHSQHLTGYVCMVLFSYAFYPFLNLCCQNRSKGVKKFSLSSFDRHLANDRPKQMETPGSSVCCCLGLLQHLWICCLYSRMPIRPSQYSCHVFSWASLTSLSGVSSFFYNVFWSWLNTTMKRF